MHMLDKNSANEVPSLEGQQPNETLVLILQGSTAVTADQMGNPVKSLNERAEQYLKDYKSGDKTKNYRIQPQSGDRIAIFSSPL